MEYINKFIAAIKRAAKVVSDGLVDFLRFTTRALTRAIDEIDSACVPSSGSPAGKVLRHVVFIITLLLILNLIYSPLFWLFMFVAWVAMKLVKLSQQQVAA